MEYKEKGLVVQCVSASAQATPVAKKAKVK